MAERTGSTDRTELAEEIGAPVRIPEAINHSSVVKSQSILVETVNPEKPARLPLHVSGMRDFIANKMVTLPENWVGMLFNAAGRGDVAELRRLREAGAELLVVDIFGYTLLHIAAEQGRRETAEYLVSQGLDVNYTSICGWTPLHCAAYNGNDGVVSFLLLKGANCDVRDNLGRTAFDLACTRGQDAVSRLLGRKEEGCRKLD